MNHQVRIVLVAGFLIFFGVLAGCSTHNPAHKSERAFVSWWKETHFESASHFNFVGLMEVEEANLQPPASVKMEVGTVLEFYTNRIDRENLPHGDWQILLVNPRRKVIDINEYHIDEYFQRIDECGEEHSYIVVKEMNEWVELEFNPYCSVVYREDEIGVSLYWNIDSEMPLIEFTTNHPACVPHYLYGWDKEKRTYEFLGEKCE